MNTVKINIIAATSYGSLMSAYCFARSISNTPRRRSGIPYVLIMNPNTTTTATASGAIYIERFSHTSRHTDQESGRVAPS